MLAPSPSSARCSTAARHLAQLAIIGERLPISIADDEACALQLGVGLLDGPGRREAVSGHKDRRPLRLLIFGQLLSA